MAQVQSLHNRAFVVEKDVSLSASSATTVGISVPAGTLVLAAGFEPYVAVPDVTTYTLDVTDGTTVFANDLNFDNTAAGTIKAGTTAGLISAADTIDIVTTISGSPGIITGRMFAVIIPVEKGWSAPGAADRDTLA